MWWRSTTYLSTIFHEIPSTYLYLHKSSVFQIYELTQTIISHKDPLHFVYLPNVSCKRLSLLKLLYILHILCYLVVYLENISGRSRAWLLS